MTSKYSQKNKDRIIYMGVINMLMCAIVTEVNDKSLLVIDSSSSQEIVVNYPCVCNFNVNDRVGIVYDGIMTRSIPPQINASKVFKMPFNKCFKVI